MPHWSKLTSSSPFDANNIIDWQTDFSTESRLRHRDYRDAKCLRDQKEGDGGRGSFRGAGGRGVPARRDLRSAHCLHTFEILEMRIG